MKKMIAVLLLISQVSSAQGLFGDRERLNEERAEQIASKVSKFMVMSAMTGNCVGGLRTVSQAGEAITMLGESDKYADKNLEEKVVAILSDVVRLSEGKYKVQLSKNARSIYPVAEIVDAETGEYKRAILLGEDYVQCM